MTSVDGIPACLFAAAPVLRQPHPESDPALATEVLPGPPPLASVQQAVLQKRDNKKVPFAVSYLPASDPGTTYGANTVSTMASASESDGPLRKRARLAKGSASTRAQRASARNMTAAAPAPLAASDPSAPLEPVASTSNMRTDLESLNAHPDSDDAMLSRSNSVHLIDEVENISSTRSSLRREKGKGKERGAAVRVKEEPAAFSLSTHEPTLANPSSNEDHCSACRSLGSLVYCDGCPRAYHLWCLDPPMDTDDLPAGDARWFCPACILRQKPPSKPPVSLKFMAPLIDHVQTGLPAEFQLPQDLRTFFKDVATGPKGTYVDSSEVKGPRLNRHGQLEEREPYRLKDRNGEPVLCFRCGTSALPPDVAATGPPAKRARRAVSALATPQNSGRSIISCDYCHLHWHLDCVDPPMAYMPPWNKRWMCPNHADQILHPKKRVPKNNVAPIEITKHGQYNNGNIEVIQPENPAPPPPKMNVEEVLINGRRFRVPERIITMDFWNKAAKNRSHHEDAAHISSVLSSPLTSISSVDWMDEDEIEAIAPIGPPQHPINSFNKLNLVELQAALALCGMQIVALPTEPPSSDVPASTSSATSTTLVTKPDDMDVDPPISSPLKPISPVSLVPTVPSTNGATEQPVRRSGRPSNARRLPLWSKAFMDEGDDLSEDSKDYVPPSSITRRKRDMAGKFQRKPEVKANDKANDQVPKDHPPPPAAAIKSAEPAKKQETPAAEPPVEAPSARPKRNRQPPRRLESPMTATPLSPSPSTPEPAPPPPVHKPTPSKATSSKPTVALKATTPAPKTSTQHHPQHAKPSNGITTHNLALNVPAPSSLHPSLLGYKPASPVIPEPSVKEKAKEKATTSASAKPTALSAKANVSNASTTKAEGATSSSGLKIRLPRIGSIMPAATSQSPEEELSSKPKPQGASGSRGRRSMRRQPSLSTSATGTSLSTPSSPKASLSGVA